MKDFKMWLNSIGYSDKELDEIDIFHLNILMEEYINLMGDKL